MTRIIKILVVAAVLIIAVLLFFSLIRYLTIDQIFSYAYTKIREATGASHWLIKGLLIAVSAPFIWSLKHALSPLSRHKEKARVIVVGYASVFCLTMWWLTRDAYFSASRVGNEVQIKAEKCFVRVPQGVKIVECDDVDPKTGLKPSPLTPTMVEQMARRKDHLFPKRVTYSNELNLFDTITGEPAIWYVEFDGVLELYDNPGRHPISNHELRPVTQDIVPRLRRDGARSALKKQEDNIKVFQERYLVTSTARISGVANMAVIIVDDRGALDHQLSQKIAQSFQARRVNVMTSLFKPAFVMDGMFDKVMKGESDGVKSLSLSRFADYIVLGIKRTMHSKDQASQQMLGENVYTAQVSLHLRVISATTGGILRDFSVSDRGAGWTNEQAGSEAANLISDRLSQMEWNL